MTNLETNSAQLSLLWDEPPEATGGAQSLVYFVEAVGSGLVKIGRTSNLPQRLESLRCGTQHPLRVLKTIAGDAAVEKTLHRRWATHRERGEWFRLDPIRSAIAQLAGVTGFLARCQDCGKELHDGRAKRCKPCWLRHHELLRRCMDCGAKVSYRQNKRCKPCHDRHRTLPPALCVDCGAAVSQRQCTRCMACFQKQRKPEQYACVDCGAAVSKRQIKRCQECETRRRKDGRPRCPDCGKPKHDRNKKRCKSCWIKSFRRPNSQIGLVG